MNFEKNHKRDYLILLVIFLVGLGLRLLYIYDVSGQPFFHQVIIDQASYDTWAQEIAAGDWIGETAFYQDPLYPYFLAVIYKLFGRSLTLVYVIQALLSSACCLPMYGIGKRCFDDRRAGLLAAAFWATYKVDFFYGAQVLKTGPGVCLAILVLWLLLLARDRQKIWAFVIAGIFSGLLPLYRGNFLVVVPALFLWLAYVLYGRLKKDAIRPLIIFGISAMLFPGITATRNYAVSGEIVLTTAQAGTNFYLGNFSGNPWGGALDPPFVRRTPEFEQADFMKEAERRTGRKMSPSELSGFWFKEALREMGDSPGMAIARVGRKALLSINRHEVSDNLNYSFFREHFSRVLKIPLPAFWLAGSFGLAGLAIAMFRRRGGLLAAYLASYFATLLIFYILGRYRMPLAPPLLVFAGYGIVSGWEAWKSKDKKILVILLSSLLVGTAISFPRLGPDDHDLAWYKLGNAYARDGRWQEAVDAFNQSLSINPELAPSWIGLGVSLENRQRWDEAIEAFENAVKTDPDSAHARYLLGRAFHRKGLAPKAEREYKKALELDPDYARAREALESIE